MMIGYIYKFKCFKTGEFYIGSTFNINRRIKQHRELRHITKQILERNFYTFNIIDKREFPNKLSLRLLENLYILFAKKYDNCLNDKLAYSSLLSKKNYVKNYHKVNKEQISKKRAVKIKCDNCGKIVSKRNISTHKKSIKCLSIITNNTTAGCNRK